MEICYCHPHPKGNKSRHQICVSRAIWVMTVSLELFEAVLVIETAGNTVCSLSRSLIVHMAFNGHGSQTQWHQCLNYLKDRRFILKFQSFLTLFNHPRSLQEKLQQNRDVRVLWKCPSVQSAMTSAVIRTSCSFSSAPSDVLKGQRSVQWTKIDWVSDVKSDRRRKRKFTCFISSTKYRKREIASLSTQKEDEERKDLEDKKVVCVLTCNNVGLMWLNL